MGDIGSMPPAYRILPGQPGSRPGESNRAPQRKPDDEPRERQDKQKPRKDDGSKIDEYA